MTKTLNPSEKSDSDFLFMIEQATKAPSGHNTQPWLFKTGKESIEIHPNFQRALKIVDPDHRELFISLGCALENLCLAASAKGYNYETAISEEGIITTHLSKNDASKESPLFQQIPVRQTNREAYNSQMIDAETLEQLRSIECFPGINFHFFKNGEAEFEKIKNFVTRGNILQMQDKNFTDELISWMRLNKKQSLATRDGLSYAVFGAPSLPAFISKPIIRSALTPDKQNKGDIKKIRSSSHFVLFTTQYDTRTEWINLGRTLQRFLLQSTKHGIAHAYMNQPCELKELAEEMKASLNFDNEQPAILLRTGYAEKAPYSLRKGVEEVIMQ
ncbi:MAG: Acg family FMN-binding oxidoreductase [Bacteroidota bacterium]